MVTGFWGLVRMSVLAGWSPKVDLRWSLGRDVSKRTSHDKRNDEGMVRATPFACKNAVRAAKVGHVCTGKGQRLPSGTNQGSVCCGRQRAKWKRGPHIQQSGNQDKCKGAGATYELEGTNGISLKTYIRLESANLGRPPKELRSME